MKKKLALLAVLLQNNQFYIFDEPFNGVDIESNLVITEIIKELKSLGKTILISSHIFSTLNDTCDEIIMLKKGEITSVTTKENFSHLEKEMKHMIVGDKVKKLKLS